MKKMEMKMKEQAYNFWTKSKLKEILDELSCDYRSSWSKGKLVSALCEQPVEAVLNILKSTELRDLLEELEASSSGNKAERKKRLLGLLKDGEKTTAKKSSKAKKVESLSPENVLTLAKVLYDKFGSTLIYEDDSFVEVSTNLDEFDVDNGGGDYTVVIAHVDTGILVGYKYWEGLEYNGTIEEPFLIESRTTKVTMRIFTDIEGNELFRVADSEVNIEEKRQEQRDRIVRLIEEDNRRLAEAQRRKERIEKGREAFVKEVHNNSKKALSLVDVPAGSFMMGALPNDEHAEDLETPERPQHEVTLSAGIQVSMYPCTQEIYWMVMGENPSEFDGLNNPVETVSWCDVVLFCNKISEMEGLDPAYQLPAGFEEACRSQSKDSDDDVNELSKQVTWNQNANGYRLPTEAEWEYCARGGESHLYSGSNNSDEVAWYEDNSNDTTHPVGQKKANGFGLYDMSGNVWEWVWDSYYREYESSESKPIYVDVSSAERTLRGGCYCAVEYIGKSEVRASARLGLDASERYEFQSFRLVRTL